MWGHVLLLIYILQSDRRNKLLAKHLIVPKGLLRRMQLERHFINNPHGYSCDVCDRLRFEQDLATMMPKYQMVLIENFLHVDMSTFWKSHIALRRMHSTYIASLHPATYMT